MKNKYGFINNFFDTLRRRRWLTIAAFAAVLVGLELARYYINTHYEFDRAYRLLLFGVALPLLAGIAFSIPSAGFDKPGHTKDQNKRRVLIATEETLLGAGINHLLLRRRELDLVGLTADSSTNLVKKISQLKPEVIILDETIFLMSAKELLFFLNDWPEMRLVVVSTGENRVQLYHKRQIQVTQSMDLVEMMCRA